MIINKL